ncbi:MAG: AraC family transcriptional regulator [Cyanobacteria bacterium P01_C01_bin.118]
MTSPSSTSKRALDWLEPGSPEDPRLSHSDSDDNIRLYPSDQGYRQEIMLQDGLSLAIVDYTLRQHVLIEDVESSDWLKFEFQLSGPDAEYSFYSYRSSSRDFWFTPQYGRIFEVEIILKRPILEQYSQAVLERLPEHGIRQVLEYLYSGSGHQGAGLTITELLHRLRQRQTDVQSNQALGHYLPRFLYGEFMDVYHTRLRAITPAMQQVIAQILSCPYRETTRRSYLKRKALKLISLYLDALCRPPLPKADLDCIYDAAAILRNQITDPPTMEQLARQVYTNRFKLYQGFHAIYGTTPLGYLRNHRMHSAYHLLTTSDWSVSQVAAAVGHSNRSRFATAFRQNFGFKPKAFQLRLQRYAS